jgi:hypothetical protein
VDQNSYWLTVNSPWYELKYLNFKLELVIFGSISGYIGLYALDGKSGIRYIENTFDELIRAVFHF